LWLNGSYRVVFRDTQKPVRASLQALIGLTVARIWGKIRCFTATG
jgi:hypothetical protein